MVSLEYRHELERIIDADPDLNRVRDLLAGKTVHHDWEPSDRIHDQILCALSKRDRPGFEQVIANISRRRITPNSDWCHDDFLIFLLLAGNRLFDVEMPFLAAALDVRRQSPNPIPLAITEVLASLYRGEHDFSGELGFLKIPFLHITGGVKVGPGEAAKILNAISNPKYWQSFSPFLRLLTLTAHDLTLTLRAPKPAETTDELIEGFKKHSASLTLRQWWDLLVSLPARLVWSIVGALVGLSILTFLFGLGREYAGTLLVENRTRPDVVRIQSVLHPPPGKSKEMKLLAQSLETVPATPKNTSQNLAVQCVAFQNSTPPFVVEVSLPDRPIRNLIAYTQPADAGTRVFTLLPVQHLQGRYRLLLPEQDKSDQLVIMLNIELTQADNIDEVKTKIVLRSLE